MSKQSVGKQFGSAVQRVRKEKGLTQSAFAKKASLHTTFVSGVEKGTRNVTVETAQKIAKALDVPLQELFGDSSNSIHKADAPTPVLFLKLGGTWDMQVTEEGLMGEGQLDDKAFAEVEKGNGFDEMKTMQALNTAFHAAKPMHESIGGHMPWAPGIDSLIRGDFLPLFSGDSSHYRPALIAPALSFVMERMRREPHVQILAGMGTDTVDIILPYIDALLFDREGTLPVLFSGANRMSREVNSDAPQNFRDLALATHLPLLPGGYYIFNHAIYRGGDFVKIDPDDNPSTVEGQITFFAPQRTYTRIGFLGGGTVRREAHTGGMPDVPMYPHQDIYDAINATATVNLGDTNDIDVEVAKIRDPRYRAVVVVSHALGNAPYPIRRAVIDVAKAGKLVLNVSRTLSGNTNSRYYISLSSINERELKGATAMVLDGGRLSNRTGKALLTRALLDGLDQKRTADLIRRYSARTF
jgi:transcriptional regulator with XRE-family HTH domain